MTQLYVPQSAYFTDPDLLNKMVTVMKALMIMGEVSIAGVRYAIGDATDGSGYCIATVMTVTKGEEKIGESLFRVDTGLSTLINLAEAATTDDISHMATDIGMNSERYYAHQKD